jgi:hypothetical protein
MNLSDKILTIVLVVILLITTGIVDYKSQQYKKELQSIKPRIDSITKKVDSLTRVYDSLLWKYDSLDAELYSSDLMLYRYETAYEILMERNPKAASQYGNIISDETE